MGEKKDKHIQVKIENVAVPEVQILGLDDEEKPEERSVEIDYSGAVPEIHIKK